MESREGLWPDLWCVRIQAGAETEQSREIKIFFKVVEHVCYLLGQKTFLVESREFLVRQIPDVTKAFEKKSRELVAVMCREYRAGKRKRYMVFGTMFPIVFGRKEVRGRVFWRGQ